MEEGHLRFDKQSGSVSLLTQPGFLAKIRLPSVAPSPNVVPSLCKTCGKLDKDRLLCPVRSLKFYLKRVESRRNGRKRLFLPIKGVSDISPATISRWICRVIRKAYESLSKSDLKLMKVTAHDVRALSSSWAYLNTVSLVTLHKTDNRPGFVRDVIRHHMPAFCLVIRVMYKVRLQVTVFITAPPIL